MKRAHTVPRLTVPDRVFSLGTFDISVRQFLLLVLGVLISVNVWLSFSWLLGEGASVLLWCMLSIPILIGVVFGWVRIQRQALEYWIVALLRYAGRPRVFVWRSLELEEE